MEKSPHKDNVVYLANLRKPKPAEPPPETLPSDQAYFNDNLEEVRPLMPDEEARLYANGLLLRFAAFDETHGNDHQKLLAYARNDILRVLTNHKYPVLNHEISNEYAYAAARAYLESNRPRH